MYLLSELTGAAFFGGGIGSFAFTSSGAPSGALSAFFFASNFVKSPQSFPDVTGFSPLVTEVPSVPPGVPPS